MYPYTYNDFLKLTPRLATRFIELIEIQANNDFCYQAMLHGVDMKKHIVSNTPAAPAKKLTEKQQGIANKQIQKMIQRGK